jgi:SET domain-containing protein
MLQVPGLYIMETEKSGRGVFTSIDLSSGDLIEICHVIEIPAVELPVIHKTVLHDYYFVWGEDNKSCAVALGFGSLYNHAIQPNADFILDFENKTIEIMAITDIPAGNEITINYHGQPGDEEKLWFPI